MARKGSNRGLIDVSGVRKVLAKKDVPREAIEHHVRRVQSGASLLAAGKPVTTYWREFHPKYPDDDGIMWELTTVLVPNRNLLATLVRWGD